jgi:toxin ParE1/3/4
VTRIVRAKQVKDDLEEIWLYIADDNIEAAEELLDRFEHVFDRLRESPGIGLARPHLGPNIRSFPVGNYLIFYRPIRGGIEIIRVLSGYRDIDTLLGK